MINDIFDLIISLLPHHNDNPFDLAKTKGGASVYMFGQRKALLQQQKEHIRVTVFETANNPVEFKAASPIILGADPAFAQSVLAAYNNAKANEAIERFGCCNSFIECSDKQRCLHDDDPFYRGCIYRKNLEAGRIFYGKNRNI